VIGKNVFLVSKPSKEEFVLKILEGGIMSDEIKIGLGLGSKCPYLVKMFDVLHGEGDDEALYVIMEFAKQVIFQNELRRKRLQQMQFFYFISNLF
jgi:hypothetical protein